MKEGSAMEAISQTAASSGEEYCVISVQRLDDLIVPRFLQGNEVGMKGAAYLMMIQVIHSIA
jgi:hypothetical protein